MMNNSHRNSDCAFGELLVSYLYDETSGSQKAEFEKHLQNCEACADELEAFSGVHFAIDEWKSKDFAPLATPTIEIPYDETRESEIVKSSWLSGLRQIFSLSPAWSLATASVAVLAICAGIAWLALNSGQKEDIADNDKKTKQTISPTIQKTPPATIAKNDSNKQADEQVNPVNEPQAPQVETAVEQTTKKQRADKVVSNQRPPAPKTENLPKSTPKRADKNQTAPKLTTVEDDEDDSLRLAELFEEIGTE